MNVYLHYRRATDDWILFDLQTGSQLGDAGPREALEALCRTRGWRIVGSD